MQPERILQYRPRSLTSSIDSDKDQFLPDPEQVTLEWDYQKTGIKHFYALTEDACQSYTRVTCLPTTGWPFADVQFQYTGTAEEEPTRTTEIENAFSATELIDNEEQQIMHRIFLFRTTLSIPYKNKLAERFVTLFNDVKEEDPLTAGPSLESLRNFYNFLRVHDKLKMPSISLTPGNLIYASWRDENKFFSIIFAKNEFAQFAIFEPDSNDPSSNIRLSGTIAIEKLLETVKSTGVLNWILDDRRSNS